MTGDRYFDFSFILLAHTVATHLVCFRKNKISYSRNYLSAIGSQDWSVLAKIRFLISVAIFLQSVHKIRECYNTLNSVIQYCQQQIRTIRTLILELGHADTFM